MQLKICSPCWIAIDAPCRKTLAVARALDVVDDRRLDIAGAQEVRVQRMHAALGLDRLLRRGQRLAEHLAAEHVARADVAALAAEQVVFETLKAEQFDQLADNGVGHTFSVVVDAKYSCGRR